MLVKRIEEALNAQINAELWSAQFYLSISMQLWHESYCGMAQWMHGKHLESQNRAYRLMKYMNKQGVKVVLTDIVDVPTTFGLPLTIFEQAMVHILRMTDMLEMLYDMVLQEKDHFTQGILHTLMEEQLDDESEISRIIIDIKRVGDKSGLYFVDKSLSKSCEKDLN